MARAVVFEGTALGPETTEGTAVAATRLLTGTIISPKKKIQHKTSRTRGSRMISGGVVNKRWTEAPIEQDPAQFNEFSYMMAMMFGSPSISTVDTGVYLHEWDPLNWTGFTPKPFTVEAGGFVRAKETPGMVAKTLGMEFTREGVKLTGDALGRVTTGGITMTPGTNEVQTLSEASTVTGGTYTLTFMGETTAAIAYDATAGTVQTAILLLPNLDSGDVVVTGGPGSTADIIFTFGGRYASGNVPLIVANSASLTGGGSYGIVETTPGAPLTQLTNMPIAGNMCDLYVDTAAASWGNTKLTSAYKASWKISDIWGPDWTANTSNASYDGLVDLAPGTEFKFTVEQDATGDGFETQLNAGTLIFPTIKSTGPTLGSSTYLQTLNFCVELTNVSDDEDEGGVVAVTYTGEIAHDPTSKKFISFDNRCNLASIA